MHTKFPLKNEYLFICKRSTSKFSNSFFRRE